MGHRDVQLRSRQRSRDCGIGVAIHQKHIRLFRKQDVFDLHQHFAGLVAVCAGTDTQIVSRLRDSELFEKHIGHVGVIVLAGVHDLFFTHAL